MSRGTVEQEAAKKITVRDRTYVFYESVKKGGLCHQKYKQLAEMGFPILFRDGSVTCWGHTHPERISIFLLREQYHGPLYDFAKELESICTNLEMAQLWAELDDPYRTLEWLQKTQARDVTKRRILIAAYKTSFESYMCLYKDSSNTKYWLRESALLEEKYIMKLLTGEAPIELMPETFS